MKTRNAITKLITATMAVVTLAAAGLLYGADWLQPVQAESGDGSVKFVSYASIGIGHGERVRLSVANTAESDGRFVLAISYWSGNMDWLDAKVPFYETEWIQVPRGEIRFSEVRREDLKTEGDLGTGRAQMMVKITKIAPAGSNPDDFPGSLEIIKDGGEESVELDTKYRRLLLGAQHSKHFAPISFSAEERLSYTFLNLNEEGSQPVRVQASVYDAAGRRLAQTDPVELLPGQWYTSSINYDELRVAGDGGMGLPVSTRIQVALMDGSVRPVNLHVSMEHVDRKGSTKGGEYYTGTVTVSGDGFYDN